LILLISSIKHFVPTQSVKSDRKKEGEKNKKENGRGEREKRQLL